MPLHIQEVSEYSAAIVDAGVVAVYADADPIWIGWKDLGPWHAIRDSLMRFCDVRGILENPG